MITNSTDRDVKIKQVYSQLDRKFEEEETQRIAGQKGLAYINLSGFPVDPSVLSLVEKNRAMAAKAAVFFKEGRNLKIGILDENKTVEEIIEELKTESYYIEKYLISHSSLQHLMTSYEKVVAIAHRSSEIKIRSSDVEKEFETLKDFSARLEKTSASELMEMLVGGALFLLSSDVHIEPESHGIKIRYRIDGVLQDVTLLPKDTQHQLTSRIKILSKLKLNVTSVPQDGSFHLTFDGQPVDVRVSLLPSAFGESIVMRILRQDKGSLVFDELGITGLALAKLNKELEKPNGMVLTTGPTGSGKTTTLYAILNRLNVPGVKIITLEDPVEYRIEGITQTPIDANAGMTFGSGLRAILRQDPDIVMVGEMRDLETTETAAQAALTGHIVLSTLHTNDAASAVPRLLDLGVKSFIIAPAINAIIGQRLVRKICMACKKEVKLDDQTQQRVKMILDSIPKSANIDLPKDQKFYHSPGCKACKGLGYKGRIGIYEVLIMSEKLEALLHSSASNSDIRKQAIEDGMVNMAQDGILKALAGITDVQEVFRVTEG